MPIGEHPQNFESLAPARRGDRDRALRAEATALVGLGLPSPLLARILGTVIDHGTGFEQELLVAGLLRPDQYYRAMASALDLPFITAEELRLYLPAVRGSGDPLDTQLVEPRWLQLGPSGADGLVIVPKAMEMEAWIARLSRQPGLRQRLLVTTPKSLRQTVWASRAKERVQRAAERLSQEQPDLSANRVVTIPQAIVLAACLGGCGYGLATSSIFMDVLRIVSTLLYLATLSLRAAALLGRDKSAFNPLEIDNAVLPIYTVLVALHREEAIAAQLIESLAALDWPASKLDIKLICEADDRPTVAALLGCRPGPQFELVVVPPGPPRTKPKALNYGLAGARGAFVTVYDAEDRPDPGQLREAYHRFQQDTRLACLQAPLVITNAGETWLSAGFALEYSMLFRLFLPMLGRYCLPMPLGGTSNHFRRAALDAAGAWDAYNMTEDADLGMRLHRLGYSIDVLEKPTLEEAPVEISVWLAQRARWFKGWMQTWLVLTRHPLKLIAEMGLGAMLILQLLTAGVILSALIHPLALMLILRSLHALYTGSFNHSLFGWVMLSLETITIIGSYGVPFVLGRHSMTKAERKEIPLVWIFLPFYLLLTSVAAWRALYELCRRPFIWNKTPHRAVTPKKPFDARDAKDDNSSDA